MFQEIHQLGASGSAAIVLAHLPSLRWQDGPVAGCSRLQLPRAIRRLTVQGVLFLGLPGLSQAPNVHVHPQQGLLEPGQEILCCGLIQAPQMGGEGLRLPVHQGIVEGERQAFLGVGFGFAHQEEGQGIGLPGLQFEPGQASCDRIPGCFADAGGLPPGGEDRADGVGGRWKIEGGLWFRTRGVRTGSIGPEFELDGVPGTGPPPPTSAQPSRP